MPSASFNRFNEFAQDLGTEKHLLGTDQLKFALTNTAPAAANANWNTTDHPAPAAVNGYSAGGANASTTYVEASGIGTLTLSSNVVFTATAGGIGPFRYAVLYNSASATPSNAGIGWYDYGSSITLGTSETLTISSGTILTIG